MYSSVHHKIALRDQLREVLLTATKERDQRQDFVETVAGPEMGWVGYERAVMLAAVNRHRTERGHPEVSIEDVSRVDRLATGHCDWLDKFALYCAELVLYGPAVVTR